jgi:glycosyltransferase involved in cell wall biosynthesis
MPPDLRKRVAFVVQRCGVEVNGGAELLCRQVAERLAARWPTEVLTTCALDYITWANHYPPGEERLGDLVIRRFPVAYKRAPDFGRLSRSIRARKGRADLKKQEEWMQKQGPWSPQLLAYLQQHKADYDVFFFVTYLYATTYFGLPLVADKALLVPTAHDEWPIHLELFDHMMQLPRGFVFLSPEERDFLRRRFPQARLNGPITGVAIDTPEHTNPDAFRAAHQIDGPYVVYVGRLDKSKGIGELLRYFEEYRRSTGDKRTQLVLVGRAAMRIPHLRGVRAVGFVSEQARWDAIAGSDVLLMPSANESLSIACLEAWALGKPVLANGHSQVLVGQCRRSQGGLWYDDAREFAAALECLIADPNLRVALGAQGRTFVAAKYRWPTIIDAYCDLATSLIASTAASPG